MKLPTTQQLAAALQLKLMRRPVSTNRHGYIKCSGGTRASARPPTT